MEEFTAKPFVESNSLSPSFPHDPYAATTHFIDASARSTRWNPLTLNNGQRSNKTYVQWHTWLAGHFDWFPLIVEIVSLLGVLQQTVILIADTAGRGRDDDWWLPTRRHKVWNASQPLEERNVKPRRRKLTETPVSGPHFTLRSPSRMLAVMKLSVDATIKCAEESNTHGLGPPLKRTLRVLSKARA